MSGSKSSKSPIVVPRRATNRASPCALLYTNTLSQIGMYRCSRLYMPRLKRRRMSASGIPCPPLRTRCATRSIACSSFSRKKNIRCTLYPNACARRTRCTYERVARVVSMAKSTRWGRSSSMRCNMMRPAWMATSVGANGDSPRAISSALTKFGQRSTFGSRLNDAVVLPAPFGPAIIYKFGCRTQRYDL